MSDQKITPNFWCNNNAKEAVEFWVEAFPDSKIKNVEYYPTEGLPDFQKDYAGKELTFEFELAGYNFMAINAGNEFKINPSISCFVNFDPKYDDKAEEHLNDLWDRLVEGGNALMPLDEYPFSKKYGWVQDKFGMSWQLILTNPEGEDRPKIIPSFLFASTNTKRAEEAINFYTDVFSDSKIGNLQRYPEDENNPLSGSIMFSDFQLNNEWFAAMDAGTEHEFVFNEALSMSVVCKDQNEIDYFWNKLSADPENEVCGWCKDKFGVSWQVVPENIKELLNKPDGFQKMMGMKKLVIADF